MKHISLFLLTLVLMGCAQKQNETNSNKDTPNKKEKSITLEENLYNIFGKVDSTNILNSIGCTHGYFGHLSSEFVIRIPSSIYSRQEHKKEYNLLNGGLQCELLIFEKDSSHLANLCSDIAVVNFPKPKRRLNAVQGKIKVFFGNTEELWGRQVNNAYIKIENLEFIDTINHHRKIEIKEKFLWQVLNLGTPG